MRSGALLRIASKSALDGKHPHALVGAVLIKGGRVIDKTANYSRPFGEDNCGFHAEERLVRNNPQHVKGSIIVVARRNKKGAPSTMSRPCKKCYPLLCKHGVKKVIYINWDGEVTVEKLNVRKYN